MLSRKLYKPPDIAGKWISISLICLTIVLTSTFVVLRRHEGNGNSVGFWMAQLPVTFPTKVSNGEVGYVEARQYTMNGFTYGMQPNADQLAAEAAIKTAGTNALPYLIAELGCQDSRTKIWALAVIQKCGWSPPAFLKPKDGYRFQALTALRLLGTNVAPVLPELRWLRRSTDPK